MTRLIPTPVIIDEPSPALVTVALFLFAAVCTVIVVDLARDLVRSRCRRKRRRP